MVLNALTTFAPGRLGGDLLRGRAGLHRQRRVGLRVDGVGDVDDGLAGELVAVAAEHVVERLVPDGEHDDVAGDRVADGAGAHVAGELAGERLRLVLVGAQQRDGVAAGQRAGGDATSHVAGADDRDLHGDAFRSRCLRTATSMDPVSGARHGRLAACMDFLAGARKKSMQPAQGAHAGRRRARPRLRAMSLIETTQPPAAPALPDTLRLGAVHLTVADLDRSVAWYQRSLGLRVHAHDIAHAELGDGIETVVVLHEDPQARPAGRHAGLYHYALLYPTREELARAAVRLAATRTPIQGASDHGTHEAIYLPDADGNGIELAWDRDREQLAGRPRLRPRPRPAGLRQPAGHRRGRAADRLRRRRAAHGPPAPARRRRRAGARLLPRPPGLRGPGRTSARPRSSPPAATTTTSASTSGTAGASTARRRTPPGLRRWTVQLPTDADVAELRERVAAAGQAVEPVDGGFEVRDPGAPRWRSSRGDRRDGGGR